MNLPKHMPSLDGMRGIAILLVILTHCGDGWHAALSIVQDTAGTASLELPKVLARVTREAGHGVQLFFVVSAFTLTLRSVERSDTFSAYAARRIARVGPAYWLAGLLYLALAGFGPRLWASQGVSWYDIGITAFFLSAWQGTSSLAVVPGGWSVSCEVTFYVLLPLVLFISARRPLIVAMTCLLSAVMAAITLMMLSGDDAFFFSQYVNPMQQLPVFLIGILAAAIVLKYPIKEISFVPGSALILAIFATPVITYVVPYLPTHIVFSVFAAIAVLYAALFPPGFLTNRLIVRIGTVSYSMYLVHFAILPFGMKAASMLFPHFGLGQLAINFAVTTVVAFLISNITYRFVEQPPMRWMSNMLRRQRFADPIQQKIPTQGNT